MLRRFSLLLLAPAAVAMVGCAGISHQQYGSPTQLHTVTPYANRGEVIANMGEPDSIYKDEGREIYVYKSLTGSNYFGLFAKVDRVDTIVVIEEDGTIQTDPITVDIARGRTYLMAPLALNATHPIPTTEILKDPKQLKHPHPVK